MDQFPVITSTISPDHLCRFLIEKYDLPQKTTCRLIKAGINHTYLVDSESGKYIFRVYSFNWRTEKEIIEEIRLINHLTENGVPVSYPIADRNNQFIQFLGAPEGQRYGLMFSYAYGEKQLNFSKDLHFQAGVIMAKMHESTQNFKLERVDYNLETLLHNPFKSLDLFLSPGDEEYRFMLSGREILTGVILKADQTQLRQGAIHTDIWFDNFIISDKGDITLFDFDFCGNGWLCQDVAYYILQIRSTEKADENFEEKKEAFLSGYESVTPLTTSEKDLIPALAMCCYYFYLGIQCQRFDNWSNVFMNETYLKRFINILVKGWFDYNKIGEKQ